MADHDSKAPTGTRIDGARTAFAAIRHIHAMAEDYGHQVAEDYDSACTKEKWLGRQSAMLAALEAAAGPLPEYQAGLLTVFAEYIRFCETDGVPDVDVWKPDALMTDAEIAERDAEMFGEPVGA